MEPSLSEIKPPRFVEGFRSSYPAWLLVLSSLLIFSPLLEGGTTHLAMMIIRMMILLLAGVYLGVGIWTGVLQIFPFKLGPPIAAYLVSAAFSTAYSPYTNQSVQWCIVLISYAGLLYLIVSLIMAWDHVVKLVTVIIGIGIFEAGVAVVQGVWQGLERPSGTFFNPNFLAGYLSVSWTVVLAYFLYQRFGWIKMIRSSFCSPIPLIIPATVSTLALLLWAIVLTGSRGGLLSLLVGTSCVVSLRFGRRGLSVLVLLVLIGLLVPHTLHDRLHTEHVKNPVGYARLQIWESSVREMMEHPLGIGLGLYQYTFPQYMFPVEGQITRYGKVAHTAHNEYLQMGVELGVLSIPIFFWGIAVLIYEAVSAGRQRLNRWQRGIIVGLTGGIGGVLIHACVDSNLHEPAIAILLILCVGIVMSAWRLTTNNFETQGVLFQPHLIWSVLGIVFVSVIGVVTIRLGFAWLTFESASTVAARQDFKKAISFYQTAVDLDPGKALYRSSLAAIYFRAFEQTGAMADAYKTIDELKTAISLNPLDGRLQALLGHVYLALASSNAPDAMLGKERIQWLHLAMTAYKQALELEPFSAAYYLELGRIYFALGSYETGEDYARKGIELEPNFLPAREWLAKVYLKSERGVAARHEYKEILSRQQKFANWNKNSMEEHFLKANVSALQVALEMTEKGRI